MYRVDTYDFSKGNYKQWEIANDYPAVYILENGKEAYIGETGTIITRADQHSKNPQFKKYKFKNMHVITGLKSHKSSARHYETLLIRLMASDGKFTIVRTKDGNNKHHYPDQDVFELRFDKLWKLLEEKELVKTKDFHLIINSGVYKYSPHIALTDEQEVALTSIVNVLDSDADAPFSEEYKTRPIMLTGEAGTGKTAVATSLFYHLRNSEKYKDQKIALVIANPSMRKEIQDVFAQVKGLFKKDVISPAEVGRQLYDIIICDETHKLRRMQNLVTYAGAFTKTNTLLGFDNTHDELDWILKQSKRQVLFYDKNQCVHPAEIRHDYVVQRLYDKYMGVRPIELKRQMRIRDGHDYVSYVYDILYQRVSNRKTFKNYDFKMFTSFSDFTNAVFAKNDKLGISRLCSGYPWKWISKGGGNQFDIIIEEAKLKWNSKTAGWLSDENTKKEVGSIYSLHGLDLNYSGVIIGSDLYYDKEDNAIKVDRANYFDRNVKKGTSDEDLIKYVLNTYAVLLTRGIEGTYVYVCDENLREYLKQFIEVF